MTIVAAMAGALLIAGYLGAVHPAGDSFAVFRVPALVAFGVAVIWTGWPRRVRWPMAALVIALLLPHVWERGADKESRGDLVLYQQNLLFSRSQDTAWLGQVAVAAPDLMTLQEVSGRNRALMEALRWVLPAQHFCEFGTVGGVAVLSRFAMVPGSATCADRDGMAAMQVDTPGGRVWLVSIHLHWPWPYGQAAHVERLVPLLERMQGPVIVGGDFNAVAWSHAVARIEAATRTQRVRHGQATFHLPRIVMPVTIDHVLVGAGMSARARSLPKAGSDHHGVLARVDWGG